MKIQADRKAASLFTRKSIANTSIAAQSSKLPTLTDTVILLVLVYMVSSNCLSHDKKIPILLLGHLIEFVWGSVSEVLSLQQ